MYEIQARPRFARSEGKSLAMNVTAQAPQVRRFRAVVTRSIAQTAVVEFDAPEGADRYMLANELAVQVPDDAWVSAEPSTGWVDQIEPVA